MCPDICCLPVAGVFNSTGKQPLGTLYEWHGITIDGGKCRGTQFAVNAESLRPHLEEKGITPYRIKRLSAHQLSDKAVTHLLEQLSMLLQAGLTIPDALHIAAQGQSGRDTRRIYPEIQRGVESGLALSVCLARHIPRQRQLPVHLIKLGEKSGNLNSVLRMLVADRKKNAQVKKTVLHAATYPTVVIFTTLAVTLLMTTQIVPAFKQLYADYNATLPEYTRITIAVSDFIIAYGAYAVAATVAVAWLLRLLTAHSPGMKRVWSKLRLGIPATGKLYHCFLTRRFAAAMALAYRSGMPVDEAIKQLAETFADVTCRETLLHIEEQIQQGKHFHDAVAATHFFPDLVAHLLRIGETTGKMDEVLEKLEHHYGELLENNVKRYTQLLEPFLIFMVAGLVCWIVISMYAPLFNIGFAL